MKRVAFRIIALPVALSAAILIAGVFSTQTAQTGPVGDAVRGKAVFAERCTGCHALHRDDEGPRLAGVYGRAAGSIPRFPYSRALKRAHIVWNDKTLDKWLADPDSFIPGAGMPVNVSDPQQRRALIAYLKAAAR